MDFSEGSSSEILGRLSTAYGVETQKQLAEKLGVSAANVSNWVQRNSVPGSAFVRCALDTGCDLAWLATGKVANANPPSSSQVSRASIESGKSLICKMLSTGGRTVLKRVMDAYKFTTQKELSEHLGISTGTISTWVRREYFPGDVVIACAIETGISLEWLSMGIHSLNNESLIQCDCLKIPSKVLSAGRLGHVGYWVCDPKIITPDLIEPAYVESNGIAWIIDFGMHEVCNGRWLIDINAKVDVYDVLLLPNRRIKVINKGIEFQCDINEVTIMGAVVRTIEFNV